MNFDFLDNLGCIAVISSDGKIEVNPSLIDNKDLENQEVLKQRFLDFCKERKRFPKNVKVVKTILFLEENVEKKKKS